MNIDSFLIAAAIVLAVATLASAIARQLHLGTTIAMIAVGLLVGPHSFRPVIVDVNAMQAVGDVGVALLLFLVGLDNDPKVLWSMRRMVLGLGVLQFMATSSALGLVLWLSFGHTWQAIVVIALALTMSSDVIAFAALEENDETRLPQAKATTAVLIFQSLISIPILAAIPVLGVRMAPAGSHESRLHGALLVAAAISMVYLVTRYLLPSVLALTAKRLGAGNFGVVVLATVFAASGIMDRLGVSMALGALMTGLILSGSVFADQIKAAVLPAKQLLLGAFFIAIGMAIELRQISAIWVPLALALPVVLLVKALLAAVLSRGFLPDTKSTAATALLLAPFDEIAYAIFGSARQNGLLTAQTHTFGILMISLSFTLSPLAISLGHRLINKWWRSDEMASLASLKDAALGRVVVVGYGYVGRSICTLLGRSNIEYIAFESDIEMVSMSKEWGHHVHYGDATDVALMAAISIDKARLVVVSSTRFERAKQILKNLRAFHADVRVTMAVQYLAERDELRRLGCSNAVALAPEGVLSFGRSILVYLGFELSQTVSLIRALQSDDYALLRNASSTQPCAMNGRMATEIDLDGDRAASFRL